MLGLQRLLPKTLEEVNSPVNGKISVIEWFGKRKIVVNKLTQSGPIMEEIWGKILPICINIANTTNISIKNILVLGLGGGSIVKILQKKIPNAKITAVDLDPEMIRLGGKYLGLKKEKNLQIIIGDAKKYIKDCKRKIFDFEEQKLFFGETNSWPKGREFDLIFVDLFKGDTIPEFLENKKFLTDLKIILRKNGLIVFNRHYYQNHIFEAKIFLDKIKGIFDDVNKKRILTNLLIFCRKRGEV